jgi:lipid A 3-O-deacylase
VTKRLVLLDAPQRLQIAVMLSRPEAEDCSIMRILAVTLLAALCLVEPAAAGGFVHEIKAGLVAHDVDGLWSGFRLEDQTADINIEAILSPSVPFLWGALRPAVGGTINTRGQTSNAYLDARWEAGAPAGLFFALGIGAAVHNGHLDPDAPDRKALGSRVLFHIPLEVGYRFDTHSSLSVYFEHMSNGNLARDNEGMDFLGVRYGYRF